MKINNLRVLVVESDKDLSDTLKVNLEDTINCKVDVAHSIEEAIHFLNSKAFDLVSTEQHLDQQAQMNKGNEMVAHLRSGSSQNKNIPVLFFTLYTEEIFTNEFLSRDDSFVLNKAAPIEKYLIWVKILLQSQYKRKLKNKKILIQSKEENTHIMSIAR